MAEQGERKLSKGTPAPAVMIAAIARHAVDLWSRTLHNLGVYELRSNESINEAIGALEAWALERAMPGMPHLCGAHRAWIDAKQKRFGLAAAMEQVGGGRFPPRAEPAWEDDEIELVFVAALARSAILHANAFDYPSVLAAGLLLAEAAEPERVWRTVRLARNKAREKMFSAKFLEVIDDINSSAAISRRASKARKARTRLDKSGHAAQREQLKTHFLAWRAQPKSSRKAETETALARRLHSKFSAYGHERSIARLFRNWREALEQGMTI